MDWSDEDQSDEEEDFNSRRMGKTPDSARKPRAHAGEYETDGFLVDDDEDEAPTKRGDDGADSLDEADEAIERAQQARKKDKDKKKPRRSRDDEDDDDDDDDDAQGHDEDDADAMAFSDEEAVVRPAGGRKTRRLPVGDWEDE
ncbi:hypothetical protein FRB99_004467 [Tulasnella sp. 403]|nr:hypothetical protein FRB99_004467 [Tulasnella sp. 403]